MDLAKEVPQYRLLEPAFFAPDLVPAGSIVATDAPPGPHLEPWNAAAVARMEEWLTIEVDEIDPDTKKKTGKKVMPNAKYRRFRPDGADQQTAVVIAPPEPENPNGTSLAEINLRTATDQRPKAAAQFKGANPVQDQIDARVEAAKSAQIIVPGPKDTTVKGGPGQ